MPRRRDEGLAHAPPFGRADRNVLQVRLVARQPPGHRHRLRVSRVHAAGGRVDHLRQLVGVGALQLREAAVLEQLGRQRVVGGQLLQHVFVGGRRAARRLLEHRQPQLAEQDLADLLRAAEVERLPGQRMRLAFERDHALGQLLALTREQRGVDQHAVALDARQHARRSAARCPGRPCAGRLRLRCAATAPGARAGTSRCLRTSTRWRARCRPARTRSGACRCRVTSS